MSLFDYNVEERVNDFVAAAIAQVNVPFYRSWLNGVILKLRLN